MAQKLILCEGMMGKDLLAYEPLAGMVAAGYEVTGASGFTGSDGKSLCLVLMSEPTTEGGDGTTEGGDGTTDAADDDTTSSQGEG